MKDTREPVEKSRYQELVEKIQEKDQGRLVIKYLEAKLETIKDRFLLEQPERLASLQMVATELEAMAMDLKILDPQIELE